MTVVIGYVNKKAREVIMGADKCASNSLERNTLASSKIYQPAENPNFLVGIAGDPRVHQLIKAFLTFPREAELEVDQIEIDEKFIVKVIIPQINKILLDQHYYDPDLNSSSIMIAYKDKVWKINGGYQLISFEENFLTMGSGQFSARGVLVTLEESNMRPMNKVIKALTLSTRMAIGVEGPYDIYVTGKGKLDGDQLKQIIEDNSKPEIIHTQNFNYIKKVLKENINMLDELEQSDCEDILYFTKEDEKDIYFVDFNSVLGVLKTNGDIIFNCDDTEEVELDIWNRVEINAKAKSLLNTVSDKFKFEMTEEERDQLEEPTELDAMLDELIAQREESKKIKEEKKKARQKKAKNKKEAPKKKNKKTKEEVNDDVTVKDIVEEIKKENKKKTSKEKSDK